MTAIERALSLARAAARECDLDVDDATLLREGISILITLPAAGAIARVELPNHQFVARRLVTLARVFARGRSPTARLIEPERQPWTFEAGTVTLWRWLDGAPAGLGDYEAIGASVRRLHESTRALLDEPGPPSLDPFVAFAVWLGELEHDGYDRARLAGLREHVRTLERVWRQRPNDPLGDALVHGDVHHGNVILTAAGPTFVDLEFGGVGPASWDFATLATAVRRYGVASAVFDAFARGYGFDPRGSVLLELCQSVYEFLAILWAARCRRRSPQFAAEAERRVTTLLAGAGDARPWEVL
ncbi:MAG: aminoglycoside phosphotransferase family protein [Enhygromyxa sp.]